MNLYQLHSAPTSIYGHDKAHETVPELIWKKYEGNPDQDEQLKRYEDILAKDPGYAYKYAFLILKKPFPKGEKAIATSPEYAFNYALHVLKGPFKAGEPAISKDAYYAVWYAVDVLKKRFPMAEDLIYDDYDLAIEYNSMLHKHDIKIPHRP
jgi:hypothetical protein